MRKKRRTTKTSYLAIEILEARFALAGVEYTGDGDDPRAFGDLENWKDDITGIPRVPVATDSVDFYKDATVELDLARTVRWIAVSDESVVVVDLKGNSLELGAIMVDGLLSNVPSLTFKNNNGETPVRTITREDGVTIYLGLDGVGRLTIDRGVRLDTSGNPIGVGEEFYAELTVRGEVTQSLGEEILGELFRVRNGSVNVDGGIVRAGEVVVGDLGNSALSVTGVAGREAQFIAKSDVNIGTTSLGTVTIDGQEGVVLCVI